VCAGGSRTEPVIVTRVQHIVVRCDMLRTLLNETARRSRFQCHGSRWPGDRESVGIERACTRGTRSAFVVQHYVSLLFDCVSASWARYSWGTWTLWQDESAGMGPWTSKRATVSIGEARRGPLWMRALHLPQLGFSEHALNAGRLHPATRHPPGLESGAESQGDRGTALAELSSRVARPGARLGGSVRASTSNGTPGAPWLFAEARDTEHPAATVRDTRSC
jgi:hypothetical protein